MTRALELESQRWAQDVAPQSLDGRRHSELAIDILQVPSGPGCTGTATALVGGGGTLELQPHAPACTPPMVCPCPVQSGVGSHVTHCSLQIISQGQTKAENITSDVGMQIKQLLLVELAALLRR